MAKRTCSFPSCDNPSKARGLCMGHYHQQHKGQELRPLARGLSVEDRFFAKVRQDGDCWIWTAALNTYGYGKFGVSGGETVGSHRWAYEFLRAEIPDGLHLDHLCRNRACVNPWHLEPVTALVNNQRVPVEARNKPQPWDSCSRGHAMTGPNVYVTPGRGNRMCRTCRIAAQARWRAARRAA